MPPTDSHTSPARPPAPPSGRRRLRAAAGAAAVAACALAGSLLAACGGSSDNGESAKSANQILSDAKAATKASGSFRVRGSITQGSDHTTIDLSLTPARSGGTVGVNGASLQLVHDGSNLYVRADQASWQKLIQNSAQAQLLADKWIKEPSSNADFTDLASLADYNQFLSGFSPEGTISKGATTEMGGRSVIPLKDSKGGTLYVAASGPAYIIRVSNPAGSQGSGQVDFDQFGQATAPAVPQGAIDGSKLGQ